MQCDLLHVALAMKLRGTILQQAAATFKECPPPLCLLAVAAMTGYVVVFQWLLVCGRIVMTQRPRSLSAVWRMTCRSLAMAAKSISKVSGRQAMGRTA